MREQYFSFDERSSKLKSARASLSGLLLITTVQRAKTTSYPDLIVCKKCNWTERRNLVIGASALIIRVIIFLPKAGLVRAQLTS
jgi:hypothetical protein